MEKIYNYNLPDDDDDEDIYDDDEEEGDEKANEITKSPISSNSKEKEMKSPINSKKEKPDINSDNEIDLENYDEETIDPNSICHRLYQKEYLIDLENLPFIQFYKLKQKNKVFSFIGVFNFLIF